MRLDNPVFVVGLAAAVVAAAGVAGCVDKTDAKQPERPEMCKITGVIWL